MKIAMVASESNPLAKTGGLADVVYALSKELVHSGNEVAIIMPYYRSMRGKVKTPLKKVASFSVKMSWRNAKADAYKTKIDGIDYYLVVNEQYFGRENIYGYYDDGERFAFFSLAARDLFSLVDFRPDIIHVHDWQTAIMPLLIKHQNACDPFFGNTKFVLTIHNPAFKGYLDPDGLENLFNLPYSLYEEGWARFEGRVSTLKCGIQFADKITTVSPTHRDELLTPEGSFGLDGVLRCREWDFCGFLNGIDTDEFDPSKDGFLSLPYNEKNLGKGKETAKKKLQEICHLQEKGGPMFGLVSRLSFQKGIHLIKEALPRFLDRGASFVCCGSGEYDLEQSFERLREAYPDQVGLYIGYSNERAHQVYAASDFFLMPSGFEPCGIGQMIAQRYASLPIVRRTGGLADTIERYDGNNENVSTGLMFDDYNVDGLLYAMEQAMALYQNKAHFEKIRRNCLLKDNSWAKSAELYLGLYKSLL